MDKECKMDYLQLQVGSLVKLAICVYAEREFKVLTIEEGSLVKVVDMRYDQVDGIIATVISKNGLYGTIRSSDLDNCRIIPNTEAARILYQG